MAHNPQTPQGPGNHQDPAGSTQMFRAFVNEGSTAPGSAGAPPSSGSSGSRVGLIVGVVILLAAAGVAAWLTLG